MKQYKELVYKILNEGTWSKATKGRNKGIIGYTIRFSKLPLLNSRRIYYKGIFGELRAFMNNAKTTDEVEKCGCPFWGAWANIDGSIDIDYARLLHDFNRVNQLERVVKGLKTKPGSRKHIISLWDPSSKAKQVPCVLSYQFIVKEGLLNLVWTQRSVDVMIGLASDLVSAWAFLQLMSAETEIPAGEVIMHLADCHIYEEHIDKAQEQLNRDTSICLEPRWELEFNSLKEFEFIISNYKPLAPIKYELKV